MGDHIGLAKIKVMLMDRSPFSGQQKQEVAYYFNSSSFQGMEKRYNVDAVPDPLGGIRISETFAAYANFITDPSGTYLEEADVTSDSSVRNIDYTKIREGTATSNSDAARRAVAAKVEGDPKDSNPDPFEAERKVRQSISKIQQQFFTWQVSQNAFKISEKNPPPVNFGDTPYINAPEWTYNLKARPGGEQTDLILTPYMKKAPPNIVSPVHWGVVMASSSGSSGGIAMNQSFQITYYYDLRNPAIAKDAKDLQPRFRFVAPNGREIDMKLTNTIYLIIEFGIGSSDNYMVVFRNDLEPHFFKVQGAGQAKQAVLIEKLLGFNSEKLFDPNHKYFTVNFEAAVGSLIIKNNVSEDPWVIRAPLARPIFIGSGPIALYGGNVQAGIAFRPIQYHRTGSFDTPETTFNFVSEIGAGLSPSCTTELKGQGAVEQIRNNNDSGNPRVHMVDAEKVNGESLNTILKYSAQRATESQSLKREISTKLNTTSVKESATISDLEITTKSYNNTVTLTSGDMTQPNGYVVVRGRSPYIFMLRCETPSGQGQPQEEIKDVTEDVMSIELSWNATSYNEIKHTGTIRFLNFRPGMENHSGTDYRSYSNRSVYLRIYAGWENGVGEKLLDPLFTGQTLSAEISTKAEREIVTFQVEDYMAALHGSKFVLSPFFDGMSGTLAVRDIVLMTGFTDTDIYTNDTRISEANVSADIGLPFANPFEEPIFRFKDGSSFIEGIMKIAKLDFKVIYFDGKGRFHYDTMPGGLFNNKNFNIKHKFWSFWTGAGLKPADQAFNMTSFNRLINDTYNVVQVLSVEKRLLARLSGGTAYKAGIYDPSAEGYLGYRKHLLIAEPALGNYDAVMRYLDNYRRRVLIPPLTARFEVFGRSTIKPLDIITLDNQKLRVMNISSHINKAENTFWQNIEGEWMFAAGSGKDEQPQLLNPNKGTAGTGANAGTSSSY